MSTIRTKLITGTAIGGAAIGGAAIANAATSSSTPAATPAAASSAAPQQRPQGPHTLNGRTEKPLTGDVAAQVRAAALAKVSGTVERVETNVDSSAPYEAHITKSDGSQVEVQVDRDFTVAAVNTMGDHHP